MRPRACWLVLALALAGGVAAAEIPVRGAATAEGEPVDGGLVELLAARGDYERGLDALAGRLLPEPSASAATDADGRFEVFAPEAGLWVVRVSAPGRVAMEFRLFPLVEPRDLPTVELRADAGGRATVRRPDGTPAAGAWVGVRSKSEEIWRPRRFSRWIWLPADRKTVTDEEGTAILQRAEGERLEVMAYAPGLVEAEPATGGAGIELRLRAGRELPLRVSYPSGAPAAGSLVRIGEREWSAGITGDDGRLVVAAPTGEETLLEAIAADGDSAQLRIPDEPLPEGRHVELTLTPTDRVSGRVIDAASRQPIPGAMVWSGRGPATATRADRSGSFRVEAGRGGRRYLQASAPGYFQGWLELAEDPAEEAIIALDPTAAVEGRVVDPGGEPVAGAELTAAAIPGDRRAARRARSFESAGTRSAADGGFRLDDVVPGLVSRVRAFKEGLAPAEIEVPSLEPGEVRRGLELVLRAGVGLAGTLVAPSGQPVAGAAVSLTPEPRGLSPVAPWSPSIMSAPLEARSDRDGAFEFKGLGDGLHRLVARAAGYARLEVPGIEIAESSGPRDLGELTLEPGVELAGRVTDPQGRPVAGAEVQLSESRGGMLFGGGPGGYDSAATGADGTFRFPDRRRGETVDLSVRCDGYSSGEAPGVLVPPERPIAIVLERAFSISGVVVAPDGSPVANAMVSSQMARGGVTMSGMAFGRFEIQGRGSTDDAGRFRLEEIPPGQVRVVAEARGWRESEALDVEMPADRDLEGLRLELRRGASIAGRVFTADGQPAAGVSVQIEDKAEPFRFTSSAATDGDGRYLLEGVEPGTHLVVAIDSALGRTARKLEVAAGVNQLDLRFSAGVTVSGRVVDGQGSPVVGAAVQLLAAATSWQGSGAQSGEDGGFLVEGVEDGSYLVRATKEGFAIHTAEDPLEVAGESISGLEIQLASGCTLVGTLIGLDPGELVDVELIAARLPASFASGSASHDGRYRIPDLGPGEWMVQASLPSGRKAVGKVEIEPGTVETVLDLDFQRGLALTGLVQVNGKPKGGLTVVLTGLDRQSWSSAKTDHQGRFRAEGLEPGRHRLEIADFREGIQHREEITLDADRDIVVDVAGARLGGRVIDAVTLEPLSGVVLSLARADESGDEPTMFLLAGGTSDSQGRFLVEAAAGEYRLRAVKEGYAPAELPATIVAGADLTGLEIALEPTRGLSLAVRSPSGGAPSQVSFALLDAAGNAVTFGRQQADDQGIVQISTAPSGRFELLVVADGAAVTRQPVEVPGPTVPVSLLPGCRLEILVADLRQEEAAATATLVDPSGRRFLQPTWASTPQSRWRLFSGHALVEGLTPGTHRVRVETADGRSWEGTVSVAPGQANRLEL